MLRAVLIALGLLSGLVSGASAQWQPAKPIRIIIPFPAGGPSDVMTRLLANRMEPRLGQGFVIENRAGAGGTTGTRAAAQTEPDGSTLLVVNTATVAINPALQSGLGYDPETSFAAVGLMATSSNVLVISTAIPARTVAELIAWGRDRKGLSYSTPGIGTPAHLIAERFKARTGLDLAHVPYKGGGLSVQDIVKGDVHLTFENPATALPIVESGGVRAIAVTSATRSARLPDIPTMVESGLDDFVSESFFGLVTRAGTPRPVVETVGRALVASLNEAETQAAFARLLLTPRPMTPDEFAAYLARERRRWGEIARAANIKVGSGP